MKKTLLLFLHIVITVSASRAQNKAWTDLDKIQVKWNLIANDYQHTSKTKSVFTLINKGKKKFPAKGWTLFFNSSLDIDSSIAACGAVISHVNGDVFQIKPSSLSHEINPGDSVRIEYFSHELLINYTAAPNGLYWVWESDQSTGYPIKNFEIQPLVNTVKGLVTAEDIYNRNSNITDITESSLVKIIPTPKHYKELDGIFLLDAGVIVNADREFQNEAAYLSDKIRQLFVNPSDEKKSINNHLSLKFKPMQEEAYELKISSNEILIQASSGAGVFYGIQSMISLMPPNVWSAPQSKISLPCVDITDEPRFGYRSLMIDAARNFKPKSEMLRILDLMALYKMNVLHFHFTDDEGWRIEIPSLPELTEIGSNRGHTLDSKKLLPPSYGAGPTPGNSLASGFYSKKDFIEILKYAKERHILVMPEIESPGHSRAAIKSMDARYDRFMKEGNREEAEKFLLRDLQDTSRYRSAQLWNDNVMCVAKPSVYRFMEKVIDELIGMYKDAGASLKTVHIGGDEVPAGVWEGSPECRKMIGATYSNGKVVSEINDLWYYYISKMQQMLNAKGLQVSGWEEVGMRKTILNGNNLLIPNGLFADKNIQLHVWLNMPGWGAEDLPYRLANLGYKVVLSPVSNNYMDLAYLKSPDEPGYYWGGFTDLDKPFYFIPYDNYKTSKEDAGGNPVDPVIFTGKEKLTEYGKSNIVGIQGLLWSENLRTVDQLYYMLLPKFLAVAERAWSQDPAWAHTSDKQQFQQLYNQSWSSFVNTVGKRELPRLDYYAGGFPYRIPTVGAMVKDETVFWNLQLPGLTIRYTTDGSEPDSDSKIAITPIKDKGVIKIRVFDSRGRGGRTTTILNE